jgi:hypothetical protein
MDEVLHAVISIVAQSVSMAVILPPEMRQADRRRSGGPVLDDIRTGPA